MRHCNYTMRYNAIIYACIINAGEVLSSQFYMHENTRYCILDIAHFCLINREDFYISFFSH